MTAKDRLFSAPFLGRHATPIALAAAMCLATASEPRAEATSPPANLLRNGSFEGALLYWHGVNPDQHRLVRGEAPVGEYKLRIEKGYVMSAPVAVERDQPFTVSFYVRGDRDGSMYVQLPPSAREDGQRAKRLWTREASRETAVTREWKRVSFTARADVPASSFWPDPHYMVLIAANGSTPIEIDGVTVRVGSAGTDAYLPRTPIEVVADCPDLPGYVEHGNLFEKGDVVRIVVHASNPGNAVRSATLRWQLIDYEGTRPVAPAIEKRVSIPADATVSETASLTLDRPGFVLARVSSVAADGTPTDSSDFPLCSLPYPKAATRPDWDERFGGSFAVGPNCIAKFQRIGFGWIRWRPHMNGQDHWPERDQPWHWFDRELDEQETHGCSTHCVLYPPPSWIMEKGNPLPTDMRWSAADPRWTDLETETTWDRFVKTAVAHYKGRSLIYEIENEPGFDHWDTLKAEYAAFTIRTARLIKATDPQARVMIDNVYGIPSAVNAAFLTAGGAKYIDVVSWHDYHAGRLTDAAAIRRMRANLDAYGGQHVEIWFNEGWAFTNTAVDEPPACTGLTCVESVNAIVDSVAEMTVAGQMKTILFHTAYEDHGMSFWDYSGPGTMLWDWYNYPLPLVAAWNTLTHHIGLSDAVGFSRPVDANFCVFQDRRNARGVIVAYADRGARDDVTIDMPVTTGLIAEDVMGYATPLVNNRLTLSKTGRAVILYDARRTPGKDLFAALEPLDRKYASFVTRGTPAGNGRETATTYRLPPAWSGTADGSTDGNPALADGHPLWRLDQVWPPDPSKPTNYRPLVWQNGWWKAPADEFGGQPKAEPKDRGIRLEFRAAHGKPHAARLCALSFIAPTAGHYAVTGTATHRMWDGKNPVQLKLLRRAPDAVRDVAAQRLATGDNTLIGFAVDAEAGDELVLLPLPDGAFAGGEVSLLDLAIIRTPRTEDSHN